MIPISSWSINSLNICFIWMSPDLDVNATEIFINGGKAFMCAGHLQDYTLNMLVVKASENDIELRCLEIAELSGVW